MLSLYGTLTSPFVRRVRIVAAELGVAVTLHDVNDPGIQAELRSLSPIWKVPAATLDGQTLLDSHAITEVLLARRGPGPLLPFDPLDAGARNAIAVADGAADALINALYLARDGIPSESSSYLRKQQDRAAAALGWLEDRTIGGRVRVADGERPFPGGPNDVGLVEIALFTALDWMRFRQTYPIDRHPNLVAFLALHGDRPSFADTRPVA
jgi:glutathione S-transferase